MASTILCVAKNGFLKDNLSSFFFGPLRVEGGGHTFAAIKSAKSFKNLLSTAPNTEKCAGCVSKDSRKITKDHHQPKLIMQREKLERAS